MSRGKLRKAILDTLCYLNKENKSLEDVNPFSSSESEVGFEIGIADGISFIFLNENELGNLLSQINQKKNAILDFLCIIKYYRKNEIGRKYPLKFDHYIVRFSFSRKKLDMFAFHERGPQRFHPEDFIQFIKNQINKEIKRTTPS